MSTSDEGAFGTAIVIGGSIAGCLAAAAVAPSFDEVIVLDRDEFPSSPHERKGVPQSPHFHALLAAGRKAMDELLPGFSDQAFSLGAARLDSTADVTRLDRIGWSPRFPTTLEFLMASRALIEWVVRDRASASPRVRFQQDAEVVGLTGDDNAITGVLLESGDLLHADLVIDASGRKSRAPIWLGELGYPAPSETTVNAHWGYSSAFVRVPEGWDPGFRALAVQPFGEGALSPESAKRAMAMWEVEGDRRWVLTVQGSAGDHPPRDEAALRQFVDAIGVPELSSALSQVEFPGPISVWRDTTNRLRKWAEMEPRPEAFLVIGDAWAAFNPVYGQGMTIAALTARSLADIVRDHASVPGASLVGLAGSYYAASNDMVQFCWNASTGLDFRIPDVEVLVDGEPQEVARTTADFADRLAAWMALDKERYVKYRETTQLLRSADWLASDEVVNSVKDNWDALGASVVPR